MLYSHRQEDQPSVQSHVRTLDLGVYTLDVYARLHSVGVESMTSFAFDQLSIFVNVCLKYCTRKSVHPRCDHAV